MLKVSRWYDHATGLEHLRMRNFKSNVTEPKTTQPNVSDSGGRLHTFRDKKVAGQNLMKFCMDVMP
jgi:hypothetical protein